MGSNQGVRRLRCAAIERASDGSKNSELPPLDQTLPRIKVGHDSSNRNMNFQAHEEFRPAGEQQQQVAAEHVTSLNPFASGFFPDIMQEFERSRRYSEFSRSELEHGNSRVRPRVKARGGNPMQ